MRTSIINKVLLYKDILIKHNYDFSKIIEDKLPENFIDEFFYKLKPFCLERNQKLTRYLILKYQNALNWQLMSAYQELDEDIIELKYKEVNWYFISEKQKLSTNFIKKWQNYLDYFSLLKNTHFTKMEIEWIRTTLNPIKPIK